MELRRASYVVLASLVDRSLHGYAIARAVRELSDGTVNLTPGTLYGALRRMTEGGLLEVKSEETVRGRRRRSYRLTDPGREAVVREAKRLEAAARLVQH